MFIIHADRYQEVWVKFCRDLWSSRSNEIVYVVVSDVQVFHFGEHK
jgi:hypothetical protein